MIRANEYAEVDWEPLNLKKMFKDTGRSPSSILLLTPNEAAYLFPLVNNSRQEYDRVAKLATIHKAQNDRRAITGQMPKLTDEFRARIEGRI